MKYDITNEEKEALRIYKGFSYDAINSLLTSNVELDIALLKDALNNGSVESISYKKDDVLNKIEMVKRIYELMLKCNLNNENKSSFKYTRGTNMEEVQRLKNEPYIDRMLSVTVNSDLAKEKYASRWENPVLINIIGNDDIPSVLISDVLSMTEDKDERIISPFTKVVELKDISVLDENQEGDRVYNLTIEKQKLEEISEIERNALYSFIQKNTDTIDELLRECTRLECDTDESFENIRKLEQLLLKYEDQSERKEIAKDYPETERREDLEDIARINKEIEKIRDSIDENYNKKKTLINTLTTWKRNIILYLMAECKEIEYKYKASKNVFQEFKDEKLKVIEEKIKEKVKELENESLEDLITEVDKQIEDNFKKVDSLLENIKNLINKEQNHARIAGQTGSVYSALNNGFEMRKVAETLKTQLENINLKKTALVESLDVDKKEKLINMSKVNEQVGTLINYLNNPKTAIPGTSITRFDEMLILEENELKRGIAEKIRDTLGEAEIRKLKDDEEYLEDKTPIAKFFGMFTGQNKLDEFMLDQIDLRMEYVKKKLASKMSLSYNYSIHELIAKARMFVRENEDDDLVSDAVEEMKKIEDELKRNFVINDTRVETIIYAKEGKDLPVDDNKKLSKMEKLEIDTYQFLNKYEYDLIEDVPEEKYQDTFANEIAVIVDYINSSNILK